MATERNEGWNTIPNLSGYTQSLFNPYLAGQGPIPCLRRPRMRGAARTGAPVNPRALRKRSKGRKVLNGLITDWVRCSLSEVCFVPHLTRYSHRGKDESFLSSPHMLWLTCGEPTSSKNQGFTPSQHQRVSLQKLDEQAQQSSNRELLPEVCKTAQVKARLSKPEASFLFQVVQSLPCQLDQHVLTSCRPTWVANASTLPSHMPKTRDRDIMVPTGSLSSAETPRCSGPSIMDNVET